MVPQGYTSTLKRRTLQGTGCPKTPDRTTWQEQQLHRVGDSGATPPPQAQPWLKITLGTWSRGSTIGSAWLGRSSGDWAFHTASPRWWL